MGYYVVKYMSNNFILQEETDTYCQMSKAGELEVRYEYLIIMNAKKNWYW